MHLLAVRRVHDLRVELDADDAARRSLIAAIGELSE